MKLMCVCNYRYGLIFGFDYRGIFQEGKTYTILTQYGVTYIYSDLKSEWTRVLIIDLLKMFKPVPSEGD